MRLLLLTFIALVATSAWCQTKTPSKKQPMKKPSVLNPFERVYEAEGMEMSEMDMGGMGMDSMGGMEGMADMDMGMGMGMGGDMGMGMAASDPDYQFRQGLQRAIRMLQQSKAESQKETVRGYIRSAFESRYDRMMANRKQELDQLRKGIEKLERELQRRTAAKERVVQLQLQSVQLAAEGLLEAGDLQGVEQVTPRRQGEGDGFGGGGYE
ncbi:MAG: hypothetical protein AB8B91_02515 [Rubripirellula sp.]